MKLATLFRDSYAELKHVRTITTAAMFAASSVVLGMFTIQAGPYLNICSTARWSAPATAGSWTW